jgi:hypothetical protein
VFTEVCRKAFCIKDKCSHFVQIVMIHKNGNIFTPLYEMETWLGLDKVNFWFKQCKNVPHLPSQSQKKWWDTSLLQHLRPFWHTNSFESTCWPWILA